MELTKMDESANSAGQSLEQLGLRLRCWREARVRGQRIPAEMWTAAVGMARQLGVHRVAKVLHLDYVRLKKRVQGGTPAVDLYSSGWAAISSPSHPGVQLEHVLGAGQVVCWHLHEMDFQFC